MINYMINGLNISIIQTVTILLYQTRPVMKKNTNIALAMFSAVTLLFGLQSCQTIQNAIPAQNISFTGASADFQIPVTTDTASDSIIGNASFSYNIDSEIKAVTANAFGESNIQSVKLTSVVLTLSDADSADNFANFSNLSSTFYTSVNTTPFTISNIPNNPDTYSDSLNVPLANPDQDLKPYFGSSMTFNYQVIGKLRRATTKVLNCHAAITYSIAVKI